MATDPSAWSNGPWAEGLVEELVRLGVDTFAIAPGSRSTPLAVAVARHPRARAVIHYDERGTAFFALGHARGAGRPAAWITTSGTAVANGLPAVVEASVDAVPMLLLTADRPPELRDTGANQTIPQPAIFAPYVRWSADLPVPDPGVDPAFVLTTAGQAVHRATTAPAGPVHLNLMFREPLVPRGGAFGAEAPHLAAWRAGEAPYTRYAGGAPAVGEEELDRVADALRGARRGLVVAGRLGTDAAARAAARLAEALGWPLLPDVLSGLRLGANEAGPIVAAYDALLHAEAWADARAPDAVLYLGRPAVSKRLLQFLTRARPAVHAVVDPSPARLDPAHRVTHRLHADVAACAEALAERLAGTGSALLAPWRAAADRVGAALDAALSAAPDAPLSEPLVARLVTRALPPGHGLVVAASMTVRDVDAFAVADGAGAPVYANRGASGIDGTLATAAGVAHGRGGPVVLLVGDLALLHDLNSLPLVAGRPVVVVVVNNGGGGIFSFLPVAEERDVFTPFFETPHSYTFAHAAAQFGLPYAAPETAGALAEVLRDACASAGAHLIEVRTDRAANLALHRCLAETVRRAVRAGQGGAADADR